MAGNEPDFDAIADELHTLAPQDFTTARNRHADALKKTDPQLAKQVRALRRPTQAAWAANLLAHRHGDLVGQLLDLGQALRDAQEHLAGEQLRTLTEQRRQLVRALTGQAERDAAEAGHPLGADAVAEVDRTLGAALADPDAARALAAGRLTAPLDPVLWPGAGKPGSRKPGTGAATKKAAGTSPASARDSRPTKAQAAAERRRRREQEQARKALAGAEQAADKADTRAAEASRALDEAESARRRAETEAEQARAALAEAQDREALARERLTRAEKQARSAEDAARTADDRAAKAHEGVQEAAERLRVSQSDDDQQPG
ncbi:hypothetical protein OG618_02600 [Kitasatospora sp. NBC_01246]|uniref:hypothetical protein n=1 Tax=Kitasatospora sp. NBC_01246 TaxID=2903570 RepID=UPI002E36289B|nr:hypothetical protein [Kitasatospora sp. NBC_01246]